MRDRDLRASLESIGAQVPGLEYAGELIDGRKKALMCAELRISFDVQRADSLQQACSILWTRHPARALELAKTQTQKVLELAELCGTNAVSIAKELQANKPKKKLVNVQRLIPDQPYRQLKQQPKMIRRLFVLEPELYAYAREAAAKSGHRNVNKLVRDALWEKCAKLVAMAPQFQPRRVQPPNGPRDMRAAKRRAG